MISAGAWAMSHGRAFAFQVATSRAADVTILYVIPPTDLDYPTTRMSLSTSVISRHKYRVGSEL